MPENKLIYVTQPSLPPLKEFTAYLEEIWSSRILTNNGPFHQQFETELADYLGVKYLSLFTNGTLALVTALQTLRISGEVITTPFSFIASANCILFERAVPVFVDITRDDLNFCTEHIEALLKKDHKKKIKAILLR